MQIESRNNNLRRYSIYEGLQVIEHILTAMGTLVSEYDSNSIRCFPEADETRGGASVRQQVPATLSVELEYDASKTSKRGRPFSKTLCGLELVAS